MGAVGVPGGAGADELCKSVEVHSSGLRQYGAIAHDRQTGALGAELSHGVCGHCACWVTFVAILIGQACRRSCAPQRQSSTPQLHTQLHLVQAVPRTHFRHPYHFASRTQRLGSLDDEPNACCRWRVIMSEFHRQQTFGSETFIDVSASGNSSGRDAYADLDAAHLYHDNNYRALPHPLQIPQDGFAHGHFAYASHSSGVSLPGKRTALFIDIPPSFHNCALSIPSGFSVPLISSAPCSWFEVPHRWVAGPRARHFRTIKRARRFGPTRDEACISPNTGTHQHRQVSTTACSGSHTVFRAKYTAETFLHHFAPRFWHLIW
jgi:hypothetical protein